MPNYKENPTKLTFNLSDSENDVFVKFDSLQATVASLMFKHKGPKPVIVGQSKKIDTANNLKGKTLTFGGAANNPDGEKINIQFTFTENGGGVFVYNFPGDYSGTPKFEGDEEPNYEFKVKFV